MSTVCSTMTTYVRLLSDTKHRLGCMISDGSDDTKPQIRILTACDTDPLFINLHPDDYQCILRVDTDDSIHQCGAFTIIDVAPFKILFTEPILFPFAPRIAVNIGDIDESDTYSDVLIWWQKLQKLHEIKQGLFMELSYHQSGPINEAVNAFIEQNTVSLPHSDQYQFNDLRKALLIDGANTFDQGTYEVICRMNHSCDPNCIVLHNGSVQSLRYINRREELVWNFLNDDYLYRGTVSRVTRLYEIWGFICLCPRCKSHFDDSRIFKCVRCSKSSIYVSYAINHGNDSSSDLQITPHFHDCFQCGYQLKSHEIEYYQSMESRIDELIESLSMQSDFESKSNDKYDLESGSELKDTVKHIKQYLSPNHNKWFELWHGMVLCFDDDSKDTICGKSKEYTMKKCLKVMDRIYNNSMNAFRWNMEWMLLNILIDDNSSNLMMEKKGNRQLIGRLWESVDRAKGVFNPVDVDQWQSIESIVKDIQLQRALT